MTDGFITCPQCNCEITIRWKSSQNNIQSNINTKILQHNHDNILKYCNKCKTLTKHTEVTEDCLECKKQSKETFDSSETSLCQNCHSMTHTLIPSGTCGKCKSLKQSKEITLLNKVKKAGEIVLKESGFVDLENASQNNSQATREGEGISSKNVPFDSDGSPDTNTKGCGKSIKFKEDGSHMYYCGDHKFHLCDECKSQSKELSNKDSIKKELDKDYAKEPTWEDIEANEIGK